MLWLLHGHGDAYDSWINPQQGDLLHIARGFPGIVVMPEGAPKSKLEAVRGYGAEIVLHADRTTLFDKLEEFMIEGEKVLDDPQRMDVVVEGLPEARHLPVQFVLARMREGRMADVVDQG